MLYLLLTVCLLSPTPNQEGYLNVVPTKEPHIFNIIYKGDMKWNVELTLFNEKGKERLEKTIDDTDGFILPVSLENEESGKYTVEVFTPVYDLVKEFEYVSEGDLLIDLLKVEFRAESKTITISSDDPVDIPFKVYILNEKGDQLVQDDVVPKGKLTRIYNLRGAPATSFSVTVICAGSEVFRKSF